MAPRTTDEAEFHDGDEGGDNDNLNDEERVEEEEEEHQHEEEAEPAAEEEEEQDHNHKRKKDKVPLMEKSGLTEKDRRRIRKNQRELFKEMEDRDDLELEVARGRNNDLFNVVRFTREAVLDGDNLIVIANKAKKQTDRMIQVPRYDADKLARKVVQKCRATTTAGGDGSSTYFDWLTLGVEAGICFNSIPSHVTFLNGPLTDESELKVRQFKARGPRQKDDDEEVEEVRPEDVNGNTKRDADQLTAGEKTLKLMHKKLKLCVDGNYTEMKRKLRDEVGEEIPPKLKKKLKREASKYDAIQFLWNPESFTQTVENIFHFSFMVKKGDANISVREENNKLEEVEDPENHTNFSFGEPGPVVTYNSQKNMPVPKQAILSLTMKDWRDLRDAFNVEKGDMPHRSGSKFKKAKKEPSSSQGSRVV